jgi:PAS domain S-box-containing protein
MNEQDKKNQKLIKEISVLKQRILKLEQSEIDYKQAQEALLESEEKYRELVENANSIILKMDSKGKITFFNNYAQKFFGYLLDEILGKDVRILLPPIESTGRSLEKMMNAILQNPDIFVENINENVLKDGHCVWISWRNKAIKDSGGNVVGNLAIGQDITQRKQYQREIQQVHDEVEQRVEQRTADIKRQADLLDLVHDAIIVRDEDEKIVFWSNGAKEMYGWIEAEAISKITHNFLQTKFPLPLQDIMDKVQGESRWKGEIIQTCKDGRQIVVSSKWALRRNEATGRWEVMEVNTDITERKEFEEALRRAGVYNRSLIEASLDPLVTIGPEGKITDVNTATEEVTGYSRAELVGTDFSDYFTDYKKASAGYTLVFRKGFVRDYELEIRHKDGQITPVFYNASVYKDSSGKVAGVFAAARDITERKQSEEQLLEKSKALEEMNMALKVLIDHYKNDQRELEERIISNINVRIIPYLEKLRHTRLDISQSALLEIIERSFRDISSPFLKLISQQYYRFTPKEMEIISLIKEGRTTKEIGQILGIGKRTVDSYRDNIRGKLGLVKKKLNLQTYLLSLSNT